VESHEEFAEIVEFRSPGRTGPAQVNADTEPRLFAITQSKFIEATDPEHPGEH
jgi:hypothetical protein